MIFFRRAQAGFAELLFLGMIFLIFLFSTPVIFSIIGINNPGGATGFVIKLAPAVILLLIVVRALRVSSRGGFLG